MMCERKKGEGVSADADRAIVNGASEAVSAVPASIPDARSRGCFEGDYPPVTFRQAENAATDLINHYFKNKPRSGGGVLVGIPARPDQDTDLLLHRFIREAQRLERDFRIRVWNEAKAKGATDASAIQAVEAAVTLAKQPPAQAIEARSGETGTGSTEGESAVAPAMRPTPTTGAPDDR